MKKILFVITGLTSGGAERVMCTLANNLCEDYKVKIATVQSCESFYPLDNRVETMQFAKVVNKKNSFTTFVTRVASALTGISRLKKVIKEYKPDVVISFLPVSNMITLLVKMLTKFKAKLIVSERNDPWEYSKFNKWFEKKYYSKADVIVCQSEKVKTFFKEKDREKCVVIENPITKDAIPKFYEGERLKKIVGVGRLVKQKGFHVLVDAFSKLPENFNDYTLEIYGKGSIQEELQSKIDSLSLQDRVFLMGAKKSVMNYVKDASLFVMPSLKEGFPNALVEAMATGLPVISTDFRTGIAKDIVKEENGILVPVNDEKALLNAIVELLSDKDRRDKMSKENVKIIDTLDEKKVVNKWVKLIEE